MCIFSYSLMPINLKLCRGLCHGLCMWFWHYQQFNFCHCFSSSELCSGWAIVITFRPSSLRASVRLCVRPSVHPSINIFKRLLLWSRWTNFVQISYGASLGWGEQKIAKMVAVHWPRWLPHPYMVKTFKNLLLQNREWLGAEPLQESSGTGGLPKLLKELSYVFIWPFYGKVKFASLCICMGKTFKNLLLQNRACLMAESLHISSRTGGLPKLLK